MTLYPAIDLKDGQAVRLTKGLWIVRRYTQMSLMNL